ncbi:thiamine pyrophosphate-binding protein [Arthrobacter sp. NamB2]|uniref:thiamine pyrophosphate-binding protein n=1 Tax=Arthrobacter sp. NamB2 TaxID=2576035 RepID=UPI0010C9EEE5|nr:thiamine pyrophosphate-binding protein [Arthrobacter sp. NamB2]TKV26494.1 thiamine pyrophosphate-binding protein [Arthrobacter sp. NamB2]
MSKLNQPSVADALVRTLAANHVSHVFGVPGGPLFGFYEALSKQSAVRPVLAKHEEGAAFMALGYAQARRGLGAVCATTGPGGTNALTGVASASCDGVPVLLITAQVSTANFNTGALQDSSGGNWSIDLVEMYRSATKLSAMLTNPAELVRLARHSVRTALDGRPGAVHLNIPADLMTAPAPAGALDVDAPATPVRSHPDPMAVWDLGNALRNARNPIIFAGQGAKIAGSHEALLKLAEWGGIPVVTTLKGKSVFPEDHPLSLGVFGFGGNPAAHEHALSDDVDLILVIGSALGEMSTHGWNQRLFQDRQVCQIDVDALQIGKHVPVDVGVVGEADEVLRMLVEQLSAAPSQAAAGTTLMRPRPRFTADELQQGHEQLQASAVVARLSEKLPEDVVIYGDNGNCLSWLGQFYDFKDAGDMHVSLNLGSMGYAMGAAIGGKLADPSRTVVALVGDGAFAMNGMEIHTATEYSVPVIWVVLNNGGHAMVHNLQEMIYTESYDAVFARPIDIATVARGLGAEAVMVDSLEALDAAISAALSSTGPFVIDAHVDIEEVPWALRGRAEGLHAPKAPDDATNVVGVEVLTNVL